MSEGHTARGGELEEPWSFFTSINFYVPIFIPLSCSFYTHLNA